MEQPKYEPFRVWLLSGRDITDEAYTHISSEPMRNADATGVVITDDYVVPDEVCRAHAEARIRHGYAEAGWVLPNDLTSMIDACVEESRIALTAAFAAIRAGCES